MAVFTAIATAFTAVTSWFGGLSLFAQGLIKIGLGLVANKVATSLAQKKARQNTAKRTFGISGQLQRGADIPQSFMVGTYATAGSLVWGEEWGSAGDTPNAYLTLVIEVSNLPVRGLSGILIDGEEVTIEESNPHANYGKRLTTNTSESKNYDGYAWVKFYDGNQTAADPWLSTAFTDGDYALDSNFIGYGNAYAIVTYKVKNEGLWNGFPRAMFVIDGLKLTNSSTGAEATTHDNPIDFIYTLLRGLSWNSEWFFGSQKIQSAQMDLSNWGAQRQKCIDAGYTMGGEIYVDGDVLDVISEALSTCNGRMAESGGKFRILAVEPDAPVATFTDEDIITTSEQSFTPFIGLSDAINGISVVYPSPEDGWQNQTAPPLIRTDLEEEDDNRRMMSDVELPFVTDDEQVQRIMKTSLDEARRARKHNHTLPSNYWQVEPLDTVEWTSTRNGYTSKRFIVDGVIDMVNGDEIFDLTETDPADYVWDRNTDFTPINRTPITSPTPDPQEIGIWSVNTEFLIDANGDATTLGIRMNWDGNVSGVDRVIYQIRLRDTQEIVLEGMNLDVESGSRLVTKDFKLDTEYEVRAKYVPTTDRETLWTDWTLVEEEPSAEPSVEISDFLRLQGETLVTSMKVTVGSESEYYKKAQVRWKLNESGEEFSASTDGPIGDFTVPVVEDGKKYVIEVTLIGADGQAAQAYEYTYTVQGKTAKPSDVTVLSVNAHGETATLSWPAVEDLDLSHYKIKHSPETDGATYANALTLVNKVPRPATSVQVPAMTGTYFIKVFDKSGNASPGATSTVLLDGAAQTRNYNVVELLEEHPLFANTKVNTIVGEGDGKRFLQLAGLQLFDDGAGNFDSGISGLFDTGGTGVKPSGTYEFGPIDLGSQFASRVSARAMISRLGLSDFFDSAAGNFDSRDGSFDGDLDLLDEIDVKVQISTSRANPFFDVPDNLTPEGEFETFTSPDGDGHLQLTSERSRSGSNSLKYVANGTNWATLLQKNFTAGDQITWGAWFWVDAPDAPQAEVGWSNSGGWAKTNLPKTTNGEWVFIQATGSAPTTGASNFDLRIMNAGHQNNVFVDNFIMVAGDVDLEALLNENWSPWQDLTVGTFSFRAAKFLVTLTTNNPYATPRVDELSVEIDMPDRIEAVDDIDFTGSIDIDFLTPFKETPVIGVTIENAADGDRMRVYNKTKSGFSVEMLTGSNTSTNEVTMSYIAKGYGES